MKRIIDTIDQGTYLRFDCDINYTESEYEKWPEELSIGNIAEIGSYGDDMLWAVEVMDKDKVDDIIIVLVSYNVIRQVFEARELLEEHIKKYVYNFGWKELAELFEPFKGEEK